MKQNGFYIIKDSFFELASDTYLKGNKSGNRPHYYCFKEDGHDTYWMIPLSSKTQKYQRIINLRESSGKPCDILHIAVLDNGKESVFLIQDMFPITMDYIEREYTFSGNHLVLTSEHTAKEINRKAKRVLQMLKHGVKFTPTQPNVLEILRKLESKGIFF